MKVSLVSPEELVQGESFVGNQRIRGGSARLTFAFHGNPEVRRRRSAEAETSRQTVQTGQRLDCVSISRQSEVWINGDIPAQSVISNVSPSAVALPELCLFRSASHCQRQLSGKKMMLGGL